MLLQRLVEYSDSRDSTIPPFHRDLEFHWQLELAADGTLAARDLTPLADDTSTKPRGVRHVVPSIVRTVGVAPQLAADDIQYVLGWADPQSKPERVAHCHEEFRALCARWAHSETGARDPVAQAVARFYAAGLETQVRQPEEFSSKQRVLIAVDGRPAYRAGSVVPFWSAEVATLKGGGTRGVCLVCGRVGDLLDTLPAKVKSTLVPGATNDAALVSINERVFGYDLTTRLAGSPVCLACGEAIGAALVDILGSAHATSYADQDSRLAWWLTGSTDSDPMRLLDEANPDDVLPWLASVHHGMPQTGASDPTAFCSLTVGGNIARIMVRDWVDMPLTELEANIAAWFDDHEMSPVARNARRHHPMWALALSLGRWDRTAERYVDFRTRGADRPTHTQRDLQRAAIRGLPVPVSLLRHLIHRISTDGHLDDARAALIRLCLTRSPLSGEKPMPDLDTTNTDPSYIAGRIFAVLEQIQQDANRDQKLNTTYGDRYFSGAVLNPRAAITSGRRDATAWLKNLRRAGTAHYRERELDDLFALIPPGEGLPGRASLLQQSQFLLGYHQQRAHRWEQLRTRRDGPTPPAVETQDDQTNTTNPNEEIQQ